MRPRPSALRACSKPTSNHPGPARHCKSWTAQRLAQAEPALAERFNQGLYLPGEGQLDNRQLLASPGSPK